MDQQGKAEEMEPIVPVEHSLRGIFCKGIRQNDSASTAIKKHALVVFALDMRV